MILPLEGGRGGGGLSDFFGEGGKGEGSREWVNNRVIGLNKKSPCFSSPEVGIPVLLQFSQQQKNNYNK